MSWIDEGVVFPVNGQRPWMNRHGYIPTAICLDDRIRVFAAFWDEQQMGRVGFVDFELAVPYQVMQFSPEPIIDLGEPGCFDQDGVTPMAVCRDDEETLWLFYAGWKRVPDYRYHIFNGVATSRDNGNSFRRFSPNPIFGKSEQHSLLRTGFVMREDSRWHAWLAESEGAVDNGGKLVPCYSFGYMQSSSPTEWPLHAETCFRPEGDFMGCGRSAIWREGPLLHGLISFRRKSTGYRIEHRVSTDGRNWEMPPSDEDMSFLPEHTKDGQRETMFASVVSLDDRLLMFYNGDKFGDEGIRLAIWNRRKPTDR